jgi:hypothetical protein
MRQYTTQSSLQQGTTDTVLNRHRQGLPPWSFKSDIRPLSSFSSSILHFPLDSIDGYPPLIHRWCSRHFTSNIWKKHRSKEVITRLKALCKVKEKKKFEARLKKLEKILNDDAKAWLLEQWPEKSKWALAFDDGGSRYGILTTNISEVFNFVLKGIRALLVSGIMDYTFHKCNEYFIKR